MVDDIAATAKGLTKAKRRAVLELPDEFTFYPIAYSRITIKRLIEEDLLTRSPPAAGFGMAIHRWTPRGRAVREHLERERS